MLDLVAEGHDVVAGRRVSRLASALVLSPAVLPLQALPSTRTGWVEAGLDAPRRGRRTDVLAVVGGGLSAPAQRSSAEMSPWQK